ncbi:hypothetical protein ACTHGU_10800 [Chitinophagaceae bacterium MMS25-I14]
MRSTLLFIALVCGISWSSCNVINPKEKIPTYVHIDSFIYRNTNPQVFGSASHKITNVWVYLNDQAVGNFELPATFPVLIDSPGRLEVAPGINVNGLTFVRLPYPFYNFDTTFKLTPNPGKVVNFTPVTSYTSVSKVLWQENFENTASHPFAKYDGDTSIVITTDPSKVFEGHGSGYLYLNGNIANSYNEATGTASFLPTKNQDIYLEMDYKCSIPFVVGLETTLSSNGTVYREYISGLNAHPDSWNKVYLNIQDFVNSYTGTDFRVIIKAGFDDTTSTGYVLMDNLKVVSY